MLKYNGVAATATGEIATWATPTPGLASMIDIYSRCASFGALDDKPAAIVKLMQAMGSESSPDVAALWKERVANRSAQVQKAFLTATRNK